ncbi:MAG: methyltransferase domain-containing protein, partial [Candidatus Omnitrophica bacterium]|nr:methyltransferase domain-containing protein [Candidatus Omnitrophota bacterium]
MKKDCLRPCPICGTPRVKHERIVYGYELLKCEPCDFVYTNLEDKVLEEYNSASDEDIVKSYSERQTLIDDIWFRKIVKKLANEIKIGKILDVGCGNGIILKHFLGKGWQSYGVDFSPWAKKFAQLYGYTLYSSTLEKAGLPSNNFDVVT